MREIYFELETRLLACGQAGEIVKERYQKGRSLVQLAVKYGLTPKEVSQDIDACMSYVSGRTRKTISFAEW